MGAVELSGDRLGSTARQMPADCTAGKRVYLHAHLAQLWPFWTALTSASAGSDACHGHGTLNATSGVCTCNNNKPAPGRQGWGGADCSTSASWPASAPLSQACCLRRLVHSQASDTTLP